MKTAFKTALNGDFDSRSHHETDLTDIDRRHHQCLGNHNRWEGRKIRKLIKQ